MAKKVDFRPTTSDTRATRSASRTCASTSPARRPRRRWFEWKHASCKRVYFPKTLPPFCLWRQRNSTFLHPNHPKNVPFACPLNRRQNIALPFVPGRLPADRVQTRQKKFSSPRTHTHTHTLKAQKLERTQSTTQSSRSRKIRILLGECWPFARLCRCAHASFRSAFCCFLVFPVFNQLLEFGWLSSRWHCTQKPKEKKSETEMRRTKLETF